jgi:predicted transcriptional regulator
MKYRSRTGIFSQILEAANGGGITKSKIMYKAFLSYAQLKEYLTLLTDSDLLHYDENTHTFKTTEKGLRFLDTYNQLGDVMNALQ